VLTVTEGNAEAAEFIASGIHPVKSHCHPMGAD
jgi:hypothetical protein